MLTHEDTDKVFDPRCLPLLFLKSCELLKARRPLFAPPADDKGAVEGARLGCPYPLDYGKGLSPVGLGLLSAFGFEDEICAGCIHPFPCLYLPHAPAHGNLASRVSFFFDKACVDPAGCVALFFRVLTVLLQPAFHCVPVLPGNGVCLYRSPLILGELALKDLPDRHSGMARLLPYLRMLFS